MRTKPLKTILTTAFLYLSLTQAGWAENYILDGSQDSLIQYEMVQSVRPAANTRKLILSCVVPKSYSSPTYRQNIDDLKITFSPPPTNRKEFKDENQNEVIEVTWQGDLKPITAKIQLKAQNNVDLKELHTQTPFPIPDLPQNIKTYLKATKQVPAGNQQISAKAKDLTRLAKTEFDAVQQILTWVIDHMHYVLTPKSFDAMYSFNSGKGNCQNYSHLAAALMRAVGIPVRIINGITLKKPYEIDQGDKILTMKMAQGRHSWVEVFFPDLGWAPFDPQGTELYVSNRFIRIETGLDNNDTEQDGLLRWTQPKGSQGRPTLEESIKADFKNDKIQLSAQKMAYGPKAMLMVPPVKAEFAKTRLKSEEPPVKVTPKDLKQITFEKPYTIGNLEFPENLAFLSARGPESEDPDGTLKIAKNFIVETAEYVTTKGRQYAQAFALKQPMKINQIGLALHQFNHEGQLWLELRSDTDGRPGTPIATSDYVNIDQLKYNPGYSWIDFTFKNSEIILPPGRYWIALGFTSGPIVNWFFSYGKPTGLQDGTRYRTMFDEEWRHSLNVEFNYRVQGWIAKQADSSGKI